MISREDAICTIGFDGNAALVNRAAKRRYGALSTAELAQAGLFRAAAASALRSGSLDELSLVAEAFNKASGAAYTAEVIPRLFGVAPITVSKTLNL